MRHVKTIPAAVAVLVLLGCGVRAPATPPRTPNANPTETVVKTDEEWRSQLTPEQYRVLREKGTERPFTGKYWNTTTPGTYVCAGCGQALFTSESKFDAGCGWPSFDGQIDEAAVRTERDTSLGMVREEILCTGCGGHLGHLFDDGPTETGLRYCVNSASIELEEAGEKDD